jgi:Protein of unknown function (DUF3152)
MRVKWVPLLTAASLALSGCMPAASARTVPAGPSPVVRPLPVVTPALSFPVVGSRSYLVVPGSDPVIGTAGRLMRFHVAIERDITGLDPATFVAFVSQTYADPRGWTAGGRFRFQRVGPDRPADFTLYLVTPATRGRLCRNPADRYTSCRNGASVVLNVDRWAHGVPDYGASLTTYRQYMVNHETGHRLGNGHELCPGPGRPAPVMEQQTLGRHGCLANAWPYVDGRAYHGRSGAYDDPIPRS